MNIKQNSIVILVLIISIVISGCNPAPLSSKRITPSLTQIPTKTVIPTIAPTPTRIPFPTPSPLPQPTLLRLKINNDPIIQKETVCLNVVEKGDTTNEPIQKAIATTLNSAGIKVANNGESCNIKIEINILFTARGANYTEERGKRTCFQYTGSRMNGDLKLIVNENEVKSYHFSNTTPIINKIPNCQTSSPQQAPFMWEKEIVDSLEQIWGLPILVHAFASDDLRWAASRRLEEVGKDDQSIYTRQEIEDIGAALIRSLSDSDPEVRSEVVNSLHYFLPTAKMAIPNLITLLDDPDYSKNENVISLLCDLAPESVQAVPYIHNNLKRIFEENLSHMFDITKYIDFFGIFGHNASSAAPLLIDILEGKYDSRSARRDEDIFNLKISAATALTKMGIDLTPYLTTIVEMTKLNDIAKGSEVQRQLTAINMLVKIARNTPEAIQYLIQIIEDTNSLGSVVVDAAILGLGQLGSSAKDAIPALKHIASYHYAMVALAQIGDMKPSEVAKQLISLIPPTGIFDDRLIIGLGILGPDVADIVVPPLIELLNNESIRVLVIRALGKMGPKAQNAIPKLIQLVKSGIGWSYGLDAIRTLGDIGPYAKVAVPTIIWAMQTNKNEKYLKICGEALAKITGKDFGIDTNRWNTWWRTGK